MSDFGIGSAIGGIAGALGSIYSTGQTNAANASQAAKQMAFQQQQALQAQDMTTYNMGLANTYNRESQAAANDYAIQADYRDQGFNASQAQMNRDFQKQQQQVSMDYNTQMSSTAYQRGMADMKAAGLNPILAYNQGGASSPTVGTLQGSTASATGHGTPGATSVGAGAAHAMPGASAHMERAFGDAVSSAAQGARIFGDIQQLSANIANTKAETALRNQTTLTEAARTAQLPHATAQIQSETQRNLASLPGLREQAGLMQAQASSARAQAGLSSAAAANEPLRGDVLRQDAWRSAAETGVALARERNEQASLMGHRARSNQEANYGTGSFLGQPTYDFIQILRNITGRGQ